MNRDVHKLQEGRLGLLNFAANEHIYDVQEPLLGLEIRPGFFAEHRKHWEHYTIILQDLALVLEARLIVDIESEMIK